MPADFNEPLARSTSAGSPPAIRYRAPPMVRNRVATAAMMPVIHTVMLLITVGRSATARGAGSAASAGAPAVTSTVMAAAVVAAKRMRLRYMGGSHLPPQQVGHVAKADRGASPRKVGCGAVGAVLLHRPKGERGEHDPSG